MNTSHHPQQSQQQPQTQNHHQHSYKPTHNIIKHDLYDHTTTQINTLINSTPRILIVTDEAHLYTYILPTHKSTIYKLITEDTLKTPKLILPLTKFTMLAKQALIVKEDYDIVIFRLCSVGKDLIDTFRVFYYDKVMDTLNPIIISYLGAVSSDDCVNLHSRIENNQVNSPMHNKDLNYVEDVMRSRVVNICVAPIYNRNVDEYLFYKNYLFGLIESGEGDFRTNIELKNSIACLESVSYEYALELLKDNFKLSYKKNNSKMGYKKDSKCADFNNNEESKMLTIINYKFKRTTKIINMNKDSKVYVITNNKVFYNAIKRINPARNDIFQIDSNFVNNGNVENSILIVVDLVELQEINQAYKKVYIFYTNMDYKSMCLTKALSDLEFESSYTNTDKMAVINHMNREMVKYTIKTTGACVPFDSSLVVLNNYFQLLKNMFRSEYLYLKNVEIDFDINERDGMFYCVVKLPPLHDNFEDIKGDNRVNKNDARKSASFVAIKYLHAKGFMDDNLCPVAERFIDKNRVYYELMVKTYKLAITNIGNNKASSNNQNKYNDSENNNNSEYNTYNENDNKYNTDDSRKNRFTDVSYGFEELAKVKRKNIASTSSFELYVETIGLCNRQIVQLITDIKRDYYEYKLMNYQLSYNKISNMWDKEYGCVLNVANGLKTVGKETVYDRKQAEALKEYQDEFYVYTFTEIEKEKDEDENVNVELLATDSIVDKSVIKNLHNYTRNINKSTNKAKNNNKPVKVYKNEIGICTGKSFTEKVLFRNIEIEFVERIKFTDEEIKCVLFLQVILFISNFRKIRDHNANDKDYCYFFVPIKNGRLDMEYLRQFSASNFLIDSVYNISNSKKSENHFVKRIDSYDCTGRRVDFLDENILYNPFTKKFYSYGGTTEKKITDLEKFNKDEKTYLQYFEDKYCTKLLHREGDGLLFQAYIYDGRESTVPNTLSSEILQVTSIKKRFTEHFNRAKKYLCTFEIVCLAHELKEKLNLAISLEMVLQCLSAKEGTFLDYERLEFLGDSVLKFVSSKYLFLTKTETLGECVTKKDSLICNESLFLIARKLEIPRYFTLVKYNENMFQPPSLFNFLDKIGSDEVKGNCKSYISYFGGEKVFRSNNISHQVGKMKRDEEIQGVKTYADVVEALIGGYFVEHGIDVSEEFIHKSGITKIEGNINEENERIKMNGNAELIGKDYDPVKNDLLFGDNKIDIGLLNDEHIDSYNEDDSDSNKDNSSEDSESNSNDKGIDKMEDIKFIATGSKPILNNTKSYKYNFYLTNHETQIVKEMKEYKQILSPSEIKHIEQIIGHKFTYPGLIEKAMIHPSSNRNVLGSVNFNKLELLGDCALDVVVTQNIYDKYPDLDPDGLHFTRKSLVNNFSLARVLFMTGVDKYLQICFDDEHKEAVREKLKKDGETVNKAFGDVLESICGAVLVDVGFVYEKFRVFVMENLYGYLEICADNTR